ncbi:MAG: large-conductance mechanosensitive channel protein MscL [Xanthomonadales bacterium]|nr:large-conductance mechanosensitive channel protein MscL [Xanthomonadales bacterium]
MGMVSEFKAFAMRGNVVDMAIGVVIGAAFGKIVSAMVDRMIMPIVGYLTSGQNFSELAWKLGANADGTPAVSIGYGAFLQATLDFVIVAFVLFLVIKAVNRMQRAEAAAPAAPPPPSEQEKLLAEIRDLLKSR